VTIDYSRTDSSAAPAPVGRSPQSKVRAAAGFLPKIVDKLTLKIIHTLTMPLRSQSAQGYL
jgi:hypothetical protein